MGVSPPPPIGGRRPIKPPPAGRPMETNPGSVLAQALMSQGWNNSTSTDKLIALMAGIANIPWEKVKGCKLYWKVYDVDGDEFLVPEFMLTMHDGKEVEVPKPDSVSA